MSTDQAAGTRTEELLALAERYAAHNYHPLPVVIAEAEGAWVTDVEGDRYLDMLAAYCALNFGHRHPRLVAAAHRQLDRLTLTSRAFHNDTFPVFCRDLAALAGKDMVLPMNTGAEAVETAIKTARRWGYDVKGVAPDRAKIIVADGNFHGRTVTIVGFSTDPTAQAGFGPFTPGFEVGALRRRRRAARGDRRRHRRVPRGADPGRGGRDRPARRLPARGAGALHRARRAADGRRDPVGARPHRARRSRCEHEGVVPDVYILGKALGGGIMPLSAVVADRDVLGVFKPGEHGSTFGGNPLACAIGIEVIDLLREGTYQRTSAELGAWLAASAA